MHIKVGAEFASAMPAMTVIGVVGDIKQGARDEATVPQMYEPLAQGKAGLGPLGALMGVAGDVNLVMRTAGEPGSRDSALEKTVHQMELLLAISNLNTMVEIVAATESSRRFNTIILTSFAALALLLSLLGLYGVLAYSVAERTPEIVIRMAMGATRERILIRTLRSALLLTAIGAAIGLAASLGLTRMLTSLLLHVKPLDATVMFSAIILLFVCAALAAWLPARRAAWVEPMRALRLE